MSHLIGLEIFINTWKAFFYSYSIKLPKVFWYKVIFTLIFIMIYRIGTYIPIPGIDAKSLSLFLTLEENNYGLFNHINFLMGGSIGRISIFSLNLVPYLSANLLFNLLLSSNKTFKEKVRSKEASFFIQAITVLIAIIQSYGILVYLGRLNNNLYEKVGVQLLSTQAMAMELYFSITTVLILVVASLILQWVAQKITSYGVGNGISIILISGIIAEISKSIWDLSLMSKIVICFTFLIISYFILIIEQTSITIPISLLQSFSLWYEKQGPIPYSVTIPINIFGLTPLILYQVLYSLFISFNKEFVFLNNLEITDYFFIQAILLMSSCLIVRSILINNLSKKEILLSVRKQLLTFHGFRLGTEISNYMNIIFNSLIGINFLYFLYISLMPEIIFNFISSFYSLDEYHLNGITIFLIVKIVISIIKQIKNTLLFDISKQIGRKEAMNAFFFKK